TLVLIDYSQQSSYGCDERFEVFGEHGAYFIGNQTPIKIRQVTANGLLSDKPYTTLMNRYQRANELQLRAFFQSTQKISMLDNVRCSLQIANAAIKSNRINRPVKII